MIPVLNTHSAPLQKYGLFVIVLCLIGCGGGSGDEATDSTVVAITQPETNTPDTTTPETDTPETDDNDDTETQPIPTSIDDLVVAATNGLTPSFVLRVDVTSAPERGYFSLCNAYQQTSSQAYQVDYQSCLLRAPLNQGALYRELQVANHHQQLIAVIWRYDGSAPTYQTWQYDDNTSRQSLNMNLQ